MQIQWVKKQISPKEWESEYKESNAYCFLGKDKEGIFVGFSIPDDGKDRPNCIPLNQEEIRRVDDYRKANHVFPRPMEDQETIYEEIERNKIGQVIDEMRVMLDEAKILDNHKSYKTPEVKTRQEWLADKTMNWTEEDLDKAISTGVYKLIGERNGKRCFLNENKATTI